MAFLESMPYEILVKILEGITHVYDLGNLVQTSRLMSKVFESCVQRLFVNSLKSSDLCLRIQYAIYVVTLSEANLPIDPEILHAVTNQLPPSRPGPQKWDTSEIIYPADILAAVIQDVLKLCTNIHGLASRCLEEFLRRCREIRPSQSNEVFALGETYEESCEAFNGIYVAHQKASLVIEIGIEDILPKLSARPKWQYRDGAL
ncbi:hypothetical protein P152DRAFT_510412 [Eremomyces bilateralis CBS 781.70]|uniref:F-box domain-containing protein n=1 Tax=Eremomyces bilateralis CBS 781.70 TaxID=1392243 RepID=A0A6G1GGJ1_9PEZI|nr:uncharacterized protein P152DRAFT_510412 [Eremomyces bilateralis CBS 781.70]KAF1817112.1 hypothetical protein P152DRAFT_510412 [Eremomyces bilateralis CBS 781.70]